MEIELKIKLQMFENALWESYKRVRDEKQVLWVSIHKVMRYVGLPRELFNERLEQLWNCQFSSTPIYNNEYSFGVEADATPTEHYRLRNKPILVDGVNVKIIQMGKKSDEN